MDFEKELSKIVGSAISSALKEAQEDLSFKAVDSETIGVYATVNGEKIIINTEKYSKRDCDCECCLSYEKAMSDYREANGITAEDDAEKILQKVNHESNVIEDATQRPFFSRAKEIISDLKSFSEVSKLIDPDSSIFAIFSERTKDGKGVISAPYVYGESNTISGSIGSLMLESSLFADIVFKAMEHYKRGKN